MIVKIMSGEDCPDDHPCKSFALFEGVDWYNTRRNDDGRLVVEITSKTVPEVQSFAPDGNVYVMNDAGKTIAHIGVSPPHGTDAAEVVEDGDDPNRSLPPRAKVRLDGLDALNHFDVPKSVWRKWTRTARHAFNAVYAEMGDVGPAMTCHPDTLKKGMPDEEWETIRWNTAWLAAHRMSGFERQKVKAREDYLFVGYAD